MEVQQLIGFYHLVREESFSRAAIFRYRTQSALSQQIKSLEDELGCLLIERIGRRKLQLTQEGKHLFNFARSFILQHKNLIEDINEIKDRQSGLVRIAAQHGFLLHIFPGIIKKYKELAIVMRRNMDLRPYKETIINLILNYSSGKGNF